jgi:hypothetical protein
MPSSLMADVGKKIIEDKIANGEEEVPAEPFIREMAEQFKVSNQAMKYRLKNLGVIK